MLLDFSDAKENGNHQDRASRFWSSICGSNEQVEDAGASGGSGSEETYERSLCRCIAVDAHHVDGFVCSISVGSQG